MEKVQVSCTILGVLLLFRSAPFHPGSRCQQFSWHLLAIGFIIGWETTKFISLKGTASCILWNQERHTIFPLGDKICRLMYILTWSVLVSTPPFTINVVRIMCQMCQNFKRKIPFSWCHQVHNFYL